MSDIKVCTSNCTVDYTDQLLYCFGLFISYTCRVFKSALLLDALSTNKFSFCRHKIHQRQVLLRLTSTIRTQMRTEDSFW